MSLPITSTKAAGPGPDEVEVSIFGPGKGESILVHLGNGDWMVVDSCIDQVDRQHPVLRYLSEISVDVSTQVKVIVLTHAHDDHIAGASELARAASSAALVTSSALTAPEFFAQVEADANIERQVRPKVREEYRRFLSLAGPPPKRRITRAVEKLEIWHRKSNDASPAARVVALSPSHHAVTRALSYLAQGTAKVEDRRRLSDADPNEFALALWVEVGQSRMLLGADLTAGPAGCGWRAVMEWFEPDSQATYFKVPHHGAPNAHHPPVWSELLKEKPVATLAPYRAGRTKRPAPGDIDRICALAGAAFTTADPAAITPSKQVKRVRAALGDVGRNVRDVWGRSGQVRARRRAEDSTWRVETFKPAFQLPGR